MIPKKVIIGIVLVGGIALGFFAGFFIRPKQGSTTQAIRENTTDYKFIHPLLAVNRTDIDTPSPRYVGLAKSLQKYIAEEKQNGSLATASVYYSNYGKPGSLVINGDEQYAPASMLKVVVMVAYLKEADANPNILSNMYVYAPTIAENLNVVPFESPSNLVVGRAYDVLTLINKMITESDNGAMNLLLAHADESYLANVYSELGIKSPAANTTYTISVKDYSLFLRVLYNGTYLSDINSERALSILSKATFKDGLASGVPDGVTIAHKFGERVNGTEGRIDSVELHDCGIIYNAGGPYLLCVMTSGTTLDPLKEAISHISQMVYDDASAK